MFDRISDAAERLAGKVSRRHFLGSLGRCAGAAAVAVAGLLVLGGDAKAAPWKTRCCVYSTPSGLCAICSNGCPPGPGLLVAFGPQNCSQCYRSYPVCP